MYFNQLFFKVCYNGNYEFAKLLIDKVDINYQGFNGFTPLMISILNYKEYLGEKPNNYLKIIDLILNQDELKLNLKSVDGCTALEYALLKDKIKKLIKRSKHYNKDYE